VTALDGRTGELLWMHSEQEGARGAAAPRQLSGRGLSYWTDGREPRILYVTPATPAIANDVVVIGAAFDTGANPKSRTNVKGYVRGFDVRTGKRLWTFHTIPRPGEVGNDTWGKDSWSYTGNTGVWAQISVDPRPIKALAQPTKQAFLYVLNRETGEPVWPFEEKPVPAGDTPGEW